MKISSASDRSKLSQVVLTIELVPTRNRCDHVSTMVGAKTMNWYLLTLSFFSLFVLGLADNVRGPIFPDLLFEFQLNDIQGSLFFFFTSSLALLVNLSARFWLPRWGAFRSLQISQILTLTGLLIMGTTTTYTKVLFGCAIFGIGVGGLGITQNVLVGQASSPEYRPRAYAALHCMYGAASLLAPILVSGVLAFKFLSRQTFVLLAAATACVFLFSLRGTMVDLNHLVSGAGSWSTPLKNRRAGILLVSAVALAVAGEILVSSRLVHWLRRDLQLSAQDANVWLAGFFGLMLLARAYYVVKPPRHSSFQAMLLSSGLSLLIFVASLLFDPRILALSGLTLAPFFPSAMSYIYERFHGTHERIVSWALTASSIGIMFMHALTGWLTDQTSLRFAMCAGPVYLGISLVFLWWSRR